MKKAHSNELQGRERIRSRKIMIDPEIYCPTSMRESDGDAECDHDFEERPDVAQPTFAVWTCTICGRAVRFDVWQ
jgi:hypothetical protein